MKRRLLLALSLAFLLCCLFALCVNAQTVISENNLDEGGDIVADVIADIGDDHHIISVDITYTDVNGAEKSGKFYYETSYWSQRSMRQVKYIYIPADFDFSQIVYIFDKADFNGDGTYAQTELCKLYEGGGGFAMYTYESYENGIFTGKADAKPYVEAVSYSKYFVKFADKGFGSKAPKLASITYNGRELVENTLIVSPLIDEIFGGSFGGDGQSETTNSIVPVFTRVVFEDRVGSVSFGQYCFTRVAFEEIIFGSGTYNLGGGNARIALIFKTKYPDEATLKRIVVNKDTVLKNGTISWNVGTHDVVFVGTQAECDSVYAANCAGTLTCAGNIIVDPCYFGHTEAEDDGDCTSAVVCPVCTTYIYKEANVHTKGTSFNYSDYFLSGSYFEGCTNEGCLVREERVLDALIEWKGYSVSTYSGTYCVVQGFKLNRSAIEFYMALNDTFELGMVALGNVTGEAVVPDFDNEKVLSQSIGLVNDYVDIRVNGVMESIGNGRIAMCLYILDDTGISFLNEGETQDSLLGISYDEIIELTKK